jgi:hypothetical protein
MSERPSLIMIQFLAWVADRPRNYAQAMEAWRSSCPRLSVWEDAIIDGFVRVESDAGRTVRLTQYGAAVLAAAQPQSRAGPAGKVDVKRSTKPRIKAPAEAL